MQRGIVLDDAEFFGACPEIRFIKTKDVVPNHNVRILLDHPVKPRHNHLRFGGIGMNHNVRNRGTIGKDKEVTFHGRTTGQCRTNLNDGVADQFHEGTECTLQDALQGFLFAPENHLGPTKRCTDMLQGLLALHTL